MTSFHATAAAPPAYWNFTAGRSVSVVGWPSDAAPAWVADINLDRMITIQLPNALPVRERWRAVRLTQGPKAKLSDIMLFSESESVAELRAQAERICTALGVSTTAHYPRQTPYSIESWCDVAEGKIKPIPPGYFGVTEFPIRWQHSPNSKGGWEESIRLEGTSDTDIHNGKPCDLVFLIDWWYRSNWPTPTSGPTTAETVR